MGQDFFPWCPFTAQGILFKICLLLAVLSEVVQAWRLESRFLFQLTLPSL